MSNDYKIVFLGDSSVGKTSLILRYINNSFAIDSKSTITASYFTKNAQIQDQSCRLQIWDTAGQERFESVAPMYYRNADLIFVVCSYDSTTSVEKMKQWVSKAKTNSVKPDAVFCILINKTDLDCRINEMEIVQFCQENRLLLHNVCAKNGNNVFAAFQSAINKLSQKQQGEKQFIEASEVKTPKQSCC